MSALATTSSRFCSSSPDSSATQMMASLRRLYRIEDGRLRFADAATVQAVADEIRARRPA